MPIIIHIQIHPIPHVLSQQILIIVEDSHDLFLLPGGDLESAWNIPILMPLIHILLLVILLG